MDQFQNHPEFYDQPIRLREDQKVLPLDVIRDFFQNCHLHEIRKTLWKMLETSLTVRYSVYDDAQERSHLFWFYRELETMIEASFLLCGQGVFIEKGSSEDDKGPQTTWKNKTMLVDEIRNLRIKNAEQENELIELRYYKEHGKPFNSAK